MLFAIIIGIHIESYLNLFRFVGQISRKTEKFGVSEIWGDRNWKQNRYSLHIYISAVKS
jgi:hypothetical protein